MKFLLLLASLTIYFNAMAQPPAFAEKGRKEATTRVFISPVKVVWKSDNTNTYVKNAERILMNGSGQNDLNNGTFLTLVGGGKEKASIILDFGKEIHGGLQILTTVANRNNHIDAGRVRVRLGESVSETMSTAGDKLGATNDHAMRDFELRLPWLGKVEIGNSGFRFARIDLLDDDVKLEIKEINGILIYRDIPYVGSFKCNDQRLNDIWATGAYTVHLNMQDYLWDGIKRDRLVWVGDMHPEVMTINSVFGYNEVVPKSLDLARETTPLPNWMSGISSYSMWWLLIQHNWYMQNGDLEYLKQQRDYTVKLLTLLSTFVDKNGKECMPEQRFLDWPTAENKDAIHSGLQSMMLMTMQAGEQLCNILNEKETAKLCKQTADKLKKYVPQIDNSKQGAALLAIAGIVPAKEANDKVLSKDGAARMSTFYGYYMLQARAMAGDYQGALDNIREFWGAMLDMGATTFWEDFNMEWMKNAAPIDNIVPEGKIDIHSAYGAHCYVGLRHSLCHGWASGPTAWMSEHILGVKIVGVGCSVVEINPHLGDLEWAEGTYPTPHGAIKIKHTKQKDGSIKSEVDAPKQVKIVMAKK